MDIAFVGVNHWHTGLFWPTAMSMPNVKVVGVSDPDLTSAAPFAQEAGCRPWSDYREMCLDLKPAFVFAFGRHCDMAEEAEFLISEGIPFAMEKPCGLNAQEVQRIAALAAKKGVFAEVPFVFRDSEFVKAIRRVSEPADVQYMSFRFIGGPPSRYIESRCPWMLDPALAGGGPTRNIGIHFFDLFRFLSGEGGGTVECSVMDNRSWGLGIEDYAAIVLRGGTTTCLIETGYGYPAPHGMQDLRFSVRTRSDYVTATTRDSFEIARQDTRELETVSGVDLTNFYGSELCQNYMRNVIDRVDKGQAPIGTLGDMAAISVLVDEAYRKAGWQIATSVDSPPGSAVLESGA